MPIYFFINYLYNVSHAIHRKPLSNEPKSPLLLTPGGLLRYNRTRRPSEDDSSLLRTTAAIPTAIIRSSGKNSPLFNRCERILRESKNHILLLRTLTIDRKRSSAKSLASSSPQLPASSSLIRSNRAKLLTSRPSEDEDSSFLHTAASFPTTIIRSSGHNSPLFNRCERILRELVN